MATRYDLKFCDFYFYSIDVSVQLTIVNCFVWISIPHSQTNTKRNHRRNTMHLLVLFWRNWLSVSVKNHVWKRKNEKKESNQSSRRKKNDVDGMKSKMFRNHRSIEVIAIVIEWRTHVVFCCAVADRDTLRPKIENQDNARPAINISLLFHFDTVDERRSI